MKSIFRNFKYVLRRFKTAMLLNIIGLSVAFVAFMLIMMQINYDYSYNKSIKDYEDTYRIEIVSEGSKLAILSRPLAELIFSQPQVETGGFQQVGNFQERMYVEKNGISNIFIEHRNEIGADYTGVFHFDMLEGNTDCLKVPGYVVIPQSIAKKFFGDILVVGKQIGLDRGNKLTIGGVYKDFPKNTCVANVIYHRINNEDYHENWGGMRFHTYAKIKDVEAFKAIDKIINEEYFRLNRSDAGKVHCELTPLKELHFSSGTDFDYIPKSSKQVLLVLFTIAIGILVIATVNYTNFSMALAPVRIKSINTRKVLGASVGALRANIIVESVFIAFIAFTIALLLLYLTSLSFIAGLVDADINLSSNFFLIFITGTMAFVLGFVSGIYPAFYMTSVTPALVLKGSFGQSVKGRKLRSVLIGLQFVVSFTLIIVASFMYLQNKYIHKLSLGYDKDQLITVKLNETVAENINAFSNQIKSFSGIADITYGQSFLSSSDSYMGWYKLYKGEKLDFQCIPVDANFLKVLGIEITEGRDFREDDNLTRHGKYIFNEKARKQYNIDLNAEIDSAEVVGFMSDVRYTTLRTETTPMAFYVWGTENWGTPPLIAYIKVNAGSNMHAAMQHVRSTLSEFDPDWDFDVRFYDEIMDNVYKKEGNLTLLISIFSFIAIAISLMGVFGLVVFENEYRRREISIRKVYGSSIAEVLQLFTKAYIVILLVCYVIACGISYYFVNEWLDNFVCRTPMHWWVFLISGSVVFSITIITVIWQSWKSANMNPVDAIKNE